MVLANKKLLNSSLTTLSIVNSHPKFKSRANQRSVTYDDHFCNLTKVINTSSVPVLFDIRAAKSNGKCCMALL